LDDDLSVITEANNVHGEKYCLFKLQEHWNLSTDLKWTLFNNTNNGLPKHSKLEPVVLSTALPISIKNEDLNSNIINPRAGSH